MRQSHIGQSVAAHAGPGMYLRRKVDGVDAIYRQLTRRTWRYRVVRFDGTLMSVGQDLETAERLARVLREGQRADYVVVLRRESRRR